MRSEFSRSDLMSPAALKQADIPVFGLCLNGERRPSLSGATFEVTSPYSGIVAGRFANAGRADAELAIELARNAFDSGPWPRTSGRTRFKVFMTVASLLEEHAALLAKRMVDESGKPVTVALNEVQSAVRTFEYYAGIALDMEGTAISDRVPDAIAMVLREPVGVAGLITPWNFPLLNPVVKIAPALAAGCTIVCKPSHLCPGPALLLAEFLAEAGLPDGVLSVVTSEIQGGAVVGETISASPFVDKIAFTGSTATGRAVLRSASSTIKRVSLELGGKSANIVFADADLAEAAAVSAKAFCFNSGQQCSAATRLLVEDTIYDSFVSAVTENVKKQVLGDPESATTTMGPLVSAQQFGKVQQYIETGLQEGELRLGGGRPGGKTFEDSLFIAPTIFCDVDNQAKIAREEVFGPVLSVIRFKDEADAVRIANDSPYGLAGGVWTTNMDRAVHVARSVRTGKMFVNAYNNAGIDDVPHGGYKESGIGREQGRHGLQEFQQVKTIQIKLGAR